MPTKKKRTNVALSEQAHALAKSIAERDRRTIGLLMEYLLRKYAEESGWDDLLAGGSSAAVPDRDAVSGRRRRKRR